MGLKATWDRLGTLGVEERHSMHERRRIVVLNRALLIGILVSISVENTRLLTLKGTRHRLGRSTRSGNDSKSSVRA